MGNHARRPSKRRTRVWLIAVALVALATAAVVVIVVITNDSAPGASKERAAQDRCESEVLKRLASPSAAKLSNVRSAQSVLDPDSRDLFSLTLNEPLKGIDTSRITVWEVSGVVDVRSEVGTTMHDPFICRAYFVDGNLADTLVLFEHDH
jgi:hypothetical protein